MSIRCLNQRKFQPFLNRQKEISEVKWVDGVFDRLSNGQKETHELTLLKNCRIWQLKPESDILMRFISYDQMKKDFGEPNPKDYQVVYDGEGKQQFGSDLFQV
ncbi:YodL domain-containing protein [Desulfosporosinus nitroreducens]|nr:YodL domain-containing protein [Desulfosporosinus nitroreducens]MCO1604679.1 YodL domain-containing protein [Desulfosporosinus nitroreducens]